MRWSVVWVMVVVVLAGCASGAVYLTTRPARVDVDSAGRIRTDSGLRPPKLPTAALSGISYRTLVTTLDEISDVQATYSPGLKFEGGYHERRNLPDGVSLTVSAMPARATDAAYSASCWFGGAQLSVDAARIAVVRACALAALPSSVSSAALAWLETDRDRSQAKRFGSVWVIAERSSGEYGVEVSAG